VSDCLRHLVCPFSFRSVLIAAQDELAETKKTLQALHLDAPTLIYLIQDHAKPLEITSRPKRAKTDDSSEVHAAEDAIIILTELVDSRSWPTITASGPLIASLMGVLSSVLSRRQNIKDGVDYLEQEVLSAMLALVERVVNPAEITKAHVGIEVIIKVIRGVYFPCLA